MNKSKLFVIIDPTRKKQPALVRAIDIAEQMGARLHVFCCDYADEKEMLKFKSKNDAKRQTIRKAKAFVDELLEPLKKKGMSIKTEIIWNAGWYQAATHASAREAADMVIKSTYGKQGKQHLLYERSDYYLIRNCTCPVLLTSSGESHTLKKVLAAVTLEKGRLRESHSLLNNRIVATAKRICAGTGAELYLVAALAEDSNLVKLLDLGSTDEDNSSEQALIAERFGLDVDRVIAKKGNAEKVITKAAKDLDVQALILGTKARKGIRGALLGNTAEKILDKVKIDVLVIN